jgi:plastocyanin
MGARMMLAAAIAGVCCVAVGGVLMVSAARSAATTVPVSVDPRGMLVLHPANLTAHRGDTVKWRWGSSGHTTTDTTGLWDSKTRSLHASVAAVMRPCNDPTARRGSDPTRAG